ncbi:MAG: HAD family hydrolase [Dehalococcoidia bacterium]
MRRTHLLFDLDGTLMDADGAGGLALRRAIASIPGAAEAFASFEFNGRTDRWILREAGRRAGLSETAFFEAYATVYPRLLTQTLHERRPRACPGVAALLDALQQEHGVVLALATGNIREAAFMKLRSVDLDRYFEGGGFGDEHESREEMLRAALRDTGWTAGDRVVVVGDTEHDIIAALGVGAIAVGVCTGNRVAATLSAAGAHATLDDLSDLDRARAVLLHTGG